MLPDSFLQFIREHQLINPDDRLLVAFSGGIDSVVLTHMINDLQNEWAIAHVNFTLRGKESEEDEDFARSVAGQFKVPFFVTRFETNNYADNEDMSVQMAARKLRYNWLEQLRRSEKFDIILTGHHLNDSLETALINFSRGTGLSGLRGMRPVSGKIVRPFLGTTREEIEVYACLQNMVWREDSSNKSDKYRRNFLRHQVVPLLKTTNPGLEKSFFRTSQRLIALEDWFNDQIETLMKKYKHQDGDDIYIQKQAFFPVNIAVAEKLLEGYGLTFTQVSDLLEGIANNSDSQLYLSDSHRINLDRGQVIISSLENAISSVEIQSDDKSMQHSTGDFSFEVSQDNDRILTSRTQVSLDRDQLKFPLSIRKWKKGDSFQPLGMKGKKKLSDFMIDAKIPLNLKERVCVLLSDNKVVWVIGHRLDDRFKVTEHTKQLLHITWHKS